MPRNLPLGYCILQQPSNLRFQARITFSDNNSETALLFIKINPENPSLNLDHIVILAYPTSSQAIQISSILMEAKYLKILSLLASLLTKQPSCSNTIV